MTLCKKSFENIVGKGENAGNWPFLLFSHHFLPVSEQLSIFGLKLFGRLQMPSIWTSQKFCHLIKS